jgi:hypothetical protein
VFSASPTFTGLAAFAQIRSVFNGSAGSPSLDLRNSNGVQWEWYTPTSDNTLHLDVWVPGQRDSVLTISNTAGSHNVTIDTGNLVIGTSGKGIDFSATPGTGTSELLADYEEGTWTPTWSVSGGTIAAVNNEGFYTKIGRQVFVGGYIAYGNATTGTPTGTLSIAGLPFTASTGYGQSGGKQSGRGYAGYNFWTNTPQTTLNIAASGTTLSLSAVYTDMNRGFSNSDQVYFFATYFV